MRNEFFKTVGLLAYGRSRLKALAVNRAGGLADIEAYWVQPQSITEDY